jgi:hypothetical protein
VVVSYSANASYQVRVYRNSSLLATVGAGGSSYTDTSPILGSNSYTLTSYDPATGTESVASSSGTVTVSNPCTGATLQAPTLISAGDSSFCAGTANPRYRTIVVWSNNEATQTDIYRNGVLLTSVSAGTTSYFDSSVSPSITYTYTLRHNNGTSQSPDSNPGSVTVHTLSC